MTITCILYTHALHTSKLTTSLHQTSNQRIWCPRRVQDRALMPATAFLEIAIAAAHCSAASTDGLQLRALGISAALPLPPPGRHAMLEIIVGVALPDGRLTIQSGGPASKAATAATHHMHCSITSLPSRLKPQPLYRAAWRAFMPPRPDRTLPAPDAHALYDSLALISGTCARGSADAAAYHQHPAVGDACLHLGALPAAAHSEPASRVPVAAEAYAAPGNMRPPEVRNNQWLVAHLAAVELLLLLTLSAICADHCSSRLLSSLHQCCINTEGADSAFKGE